VENLQIRPEQALAAFEAKMELDELSAYQHEMEMTILQPQKDFRYVSLIILEKSSLKLKMTKLGFRLLNKVCTEQYLIYHL
jgi:hypothetical protein